MDESSAQVIDNEKHKTRKCYEWCVLDGLSGDVMFYYVTEEAVPTAWRASCWAAIRAMSRQTDTPHMTSSKRSPGSPCTDLGHHLRRKFVEALDTDKRHATEAIAYISKLYNGGEGGRVKNYCGTAQGKTRQGVVSGNPGLRELDERHVSDSPSEEQDRPGNLICFCSSS